MAATDANLGLFWGGSSTTAPYLHYMMSDFISPTINDARNNATKVLSLIPKDTKYYGGKFIQERVKFGRNPKQFTNVGDDGNFPDPGQRKMRWMTSRSRQGFARFILQGKLVRAASRDQMASVDPLADDMENFLDDYLVDKARQMYSDGSGRLCEIAEAGAALTTQQFTMRVNQDIATNLGAPGATTAGCPDQPPTQYLQPGMRVLIITAGGTPRCIANVDSIDDANQATLTFLAAPAGADFAAAGVVLGDWVVKTGSNDVSSTNRIQQNSAWKSEPMGLMGILGFEGTIDGNGPATEVASDPTVSVENGSFGTPATNFTAYTWGGTDAPVHTARDWFQGLAARSAAIGWEAELTFNQGVSVNNLGVPRLPLESVFMRALTTLELANNAQVQLWLSHHNVRNTYAEQLTGEKRYNDTLELRGGWSPSLVGPAGIPWVVDKDCWHNRCIGLALETGGFKQYIMEDLSWATEHGASIWQYLQDQDKYQARLVEDYQVFVGVRNRCGITILDLLEA